MASKTSADDSHDDEHLKDDDDDDGESSSSSTSSTSERHDRLSALPRDGHKDMVHVTVRRGTRPLSSSSSYIPEIPFLPSIPSISESASETEEERRRILNDIFNEDDDDDDEDGDGDDVEDGDGEEGNEDIVDVDATMDALAGGVAVSKNGRDDRLVEGRAEEGLAATATAATTTTGKTSIDDDGDGDGGNPTANNGSQWRIVARKRVESESAFSSSSDEEDDRDEQDGNCNVGPRLGHPTHWQRDVILPPPPPPPPPANTLAMVHSEDVVHPSDPAPPPTPTPTHAHANANDSLAKTPRFSNTTAAFPTARRDDGDDDEGASACPSQMSSSSSHLLSHRDCADESMASFSWIPSVDSSSVTHVAGRDDLEEEEEEDEDAPIDSRSGDIDSDVVDRIAAAAAAEAARLLAEEGVAAAVPSDGEKHERECDNDEQHDNKDTGNRHPISTSQPVRARSGSPLSTQSAFDRALNEMQQGGASGSGRSRSNSFSLSNGIPSANTSKEVGAATESEELSVDVHGKVDDDFLVQAETIVLDEILKEVPTTEEDDGECDVVTNSGQNVSSPMSTPNRTRQSNPSMAASNAASTSSGIDHFQDDIDDIADKSKHPSSQSDGSDADRTSELTRIHSLTSLRPKQDDVLANLPDVLTSVRQKIESLHLFDADVSSADRAEGNSSIVGDPPNHPPSIPSSSHSTAIIPTTATTITNDSSTAPATFQRYYENEEERERARRSFQQSISASVLVSLAHKRYERRRLAAMEIEKVVRSLVLQEDYPRVRDILLSLSDDYVRSTNEDARKGGAVALAACAIGLKKADEKERDVVECRDLILASVVNACQDHSQRVRYYATESLFNVTKVIPSLAVQHFFILFEILRSLYADVDLDVRSGAELLDKKLKEVIVVAINSGSFSADACVPVFARFVYMRNKATKQLTLTWLREFSEKLIGAPILEFLHLFLGGIFAMVADPNPTIRQLAIEFLQSVLPKLLVNNQDFEDADAQQKIDFDKILQSLVLTMEHPDPFVRKVAMYWMSRIVQAHMSQAFPSSGTKGAEGTDETMGVESIHGESGIDISFSSGGRKPRSTRHLTAASISVRNALPHVLPGILLSIGDTHQARSKDSFLPDHTTHSLAEQANLCLQDAVRRDGHAFIPHLGGFIVALREELDSPGGLIARNPPPVERRPYRMDVKPDGSGIESTGWFRSSDGVEERDNALILSRLCALQWVVVLYEHVVPDSLKSEYASEFIDCIIYQLVDQPPGIIIVKSFEVLAKITNPAEGEVSLFSPILSPEYDDSLDATIPSNHNPMDDENTNFALGILEPSRRKLLSRDREVFASIVDLHSKHQKLLLDLSKVIELMCTLQPPEFVFVSFANELDNFVLERMKKREKVLESPETDAQGVKRELAAFAKDLAFVSNFAQQLVIVFFAAPETEDFRELLKDSIGFKDDTIRDERRSRLFHILLHTFSHNIVAAVTFSLWGSAFLTASTFLQHIDPLDVSLMFYLELDQLIDLIERPLFRHLHLRMLDCEDDPCTEGSGAMLFRTLKSILMLLPQSTSYMILKDRLLSVARFRQSAVALQGLSKRVDDGSQTDVFVKRVIQVRKLHCDAKWRNIRAESLEEPSRYISGDQKLTTARHRREWLGYADEQDELDTKERIKRDFLGESSQTAEMVGVYEEFQDTNPASSSQFMAEDAPTDDPPDIANENACDTCLKSNSTKGLIQQFERMNSGERDRRKPQWQEYWTGRQ